MSAKEDRISPNDIPRELSPKLQKEANKIIRRLKWVPDEIDDVKIERSVSYTQRRMLVIELKEAGFTVDQIMAVMRIGRGTVYMDIGRAEDERRRGISSDWLVNKFVSGIHDLEIHHQWAQGMSEQALEHKDKLGYRQCAVGCAARKAELVAHMFQAGTLASVLKGDKDGEASGDITEIFESTFRERLKALAGSNGMEEERPSRLNGGVVIEDAKLVGGSNGSNGKNGKRGKNGDGSV